MTVFWTFEHVFDAGFKSVYPMAIDGAGEGNRTSRQFSVSESSCGKKELLVGYDTLYIAALERVRGKVSARQFQIFDLVVNKEWRPADVAKLVGVTLEQRLKPKPDGPIPRWTANDQSQVNIVSTEVWRYSTGLFPE
ncbi:MAG TPA: hypothetical protein VFC44_14215 [Candidatus Saccharimonadales bacterium]|nr:hypothetical protein [Candidatus Saccharimonadales bacterium]